MPSKPSDDPSPKKEERRSVKLRADIVSKAAIIVEVDGGGAGEYLSGLIDLARLDADYERALDELAKRRKRH